MKKSVEFSFTNKLFSCRCRKARNFPRPGNVSGVYVEKAMNCLLQGEAVMSGLSRLSRKFRTTTRKQGIVTIKTTKTCPGDLVPGHHEQGNCPGKLFTHHNSL